VLTLTVFIRILANPIANVFQKQLTQRSAHPVFIIAIVHAALALICLPFFLTSSAFGVAPAVWTNMLIAAIKSAGASGTPTRASVETAVAGTDYKGITTTIKFQSNGDLESSVQTVNLFTVKNKAIVQVGNIQDQS
jgi:multidrug transporter EmrE-like cation transporter